MVEGTNARRGQPRLPRGTYVAVVLTAVGLSGWGFLTTAGIASVAPVDAPSIIPWHQIGDVGIGMPKQRVSAEYGRGRLVDSGSALDPSLWSYGVRGGQLEVAYSKGRVAGV